jgi:Tfp pilus assembly protein FimT
MSFARAHAHRTAGVSLIEILVVLGIVGLLVLILPGQIKRARKSDLRGDAARLAAAMRFGYDRAAATAAHHRLVLDLDAETFQLERCEGPVKLVRTIDEAQAQEAQAILEQYKNLPAQAEAIASGQQGVSAIADVGASATGVQCAPVKGKDGKLQELTRKQNIGISKVYVAHLTDPAGEGKVTINFFPLGRAERAVIELSDDDNHIYSLRLHSLTGRVDIREGEYHRPDEVVSKGEEQR